MSRTLLAIAIAAQLTSSTTAQQAKAPFSGKTQTVAHDHAGHNHAAHVHSAKGPNKGDLLEIGRGEYHGELVVDEESKQVVVYLLDGSLKNYVAIDSAFVTVNFKNGTQPAQVKLLPVPQDVDAKGSSSRFGLISPELYEALHDNHSDAKLSLRIGKKNYVSKLAHTDDTLHTGRIPSTTVPQKR